MPTYDYVCDACAHEFELFQPITAKPERRCPKCKKLKLRRLFGTGAAVMFKGTGFYTTDYRSESYHKAAKADKAESTSSTDASSGASSGDGKSSPSSEKKKNSADAKKPDAKKSDAKSKKSD
jgi:putative FmdB family regulatory protein